MMCVVLILGLHSCKNEKFGRKETPSAPVEENANRGLQNDEFSILGIHNDQISQVVRTIFQDSKGVLWFGTQNGTFKKQGDSLVYIHQIKDKYGKPVTVKDINEDRHGVIWVGHTSGISSIDHEKVTNYDESDGLVDEDVWSLEADKNGKIWIGTIEGVSIFDGKKFIDFHLPEGKIDASLEISSQKIVHDIFEDSNGTMWFCTNAGLFSFTNGILTNVSKQSGMKTNFINEIFEDKSGKLWVSTKNGLYKLIDGKAIDIVEGKLDKGKGIGALAEDKNGVLWFVHNQHLLFKHDKNTIVEFEKSKNNKGPVVFKIFKDQSERLWFVGTGGAFRLENNQFVHVTKYGPW